MPVLKRDARKLARAAALRWEPVLRGEPPRDYQEIAAEVGVSERTLRRWRDLPEWNSALAELDSPQADRELIGRAKATLHGLLGDPDPRVRLGAVRCTLDYVLARRLEVQHSGEVVYMKRFDLRGVDPDTLHAWVTEAAAAEGIGPGAQAALPDPDLLEGDYAEADPEPAEAVV